MNQNIINYLKENRSKYPKEILAKELEKNGYSAQDIEEGVLMVYQDSTQPVQFGKSNFFDFKSKKVYISKSGKVKDFFFGFFAPIILGFFIGLIPFIGPLVFICLFVYSLFYLFNRRRYIFYGMIAEFIFGIISILIVMSFFMFSGGFYF